MGFSIRLAQEDELDQIYEIIKSCKLFYYPRIIYQKLIEYKRILVVVCKDQIVGFLSYFLLPFKTGGFLMQIGFYPKFRGQGLGKMLLNRAYRYLKQDRVYEIYAHTLRERAAAWFENRGWKLLAQVPSLWLFKLDINKDKP